MKMKNLRRFTLFLGLCLLFQDAVPVAAALQQENNSSYPISELTDPVPELEKIDEVVIDEIEFKKARVQDAVRVLSELANVNIVATEEAGNAMVSLFVRKLTVEQIVDAICRISGLWFRHNEKSDIYLIMTTDEYKKDIVVFRDEPTRMFKLKYLNVGIAARTVADLFGERVQLMGKADRHYGDDFTVESSYSKFSESIDEGTMDEDGDDDDDEDNDSTNRQRQSSKDVSLDKVDLTTGQIDLLESMAKQQIRAVADGMVGRISQRAEAPIYVTVNRLHNMLFVRTSDENAMKEIAQIIEDSDQQVPEVLLEMKVLEVQLTDQFESAFDISNLSGTTETGSSDGHAINPLNTSASSVTSSLTSSGNFGVMEGSTLVFQALSSQLRVRLQLLEEDNNIKALATPMLLAANNHPARLFIGEETVLTTGFESQDVEVTSGDDVTITSYPVPVTEVKDIGNTLTILPSINADRSVVMRLVHENSTVETNGASIPLLVGSNIEQVAVDTINTSTLEATVLAQDGMTVAVGGMMRTTKSRSESKVPILGDIPLLGFFFKDINDIEVKTELVLLITPHVLSAPSQGEEVTKHRLGELMDHPNEIDMYLASMEEQRQQLQRRHLSARIIGDDIEQRVSEIPAGAVDTVVVQPEKEDKPKQPPQSEDISVISGLEKSFIELIRVAAKQVRRPFLMRQPKGHVKPVALLALGQPQLFEGNILVTKPTASWTNGMHYVTAIEVFNRTQQSASVDVKKLIKPWMAATLERQQLAPAGMDGSSTYLYLISEKSFEKALQSEEN